MHNLKSVSIYIIHNLSKKAKSHHLIVLLPLFTILVTHSIRKTVGCFILFDDLKNDQDFNILFLLSYMYLIILLCVYLLVFTRQCKPYITRRM